MAAPAEDPDPVPLFGEVDQLEVDGEGLGNRLGAVRIECLDQVYDLPQPLLRLRATAPAELDRRPAQPLDILEQALTVGLLEDLAKDRAELPDFSPERGGRVFQVRSDRYFFALLATLALLAAFALLG
jgi:hypothetical protein